MYAQALDEFPVSFQICVKEQTNSQDRYIKFGYDNIWSFYKGITDYDGVWVGWAGHNSTKTSVKGKIIVKPSPEVQSPKVKTKGTWADTIIT